MPNHHASLNLVFSALSDPTRRGVLVRLCQGPTTVSELAQSYTMALPSFTQHLAVLEKAGLVHSRKVGRSRIYRIEPEAMRHAEAWLEQQRALWEQRLDQLDEYLLQMKEQAE